MGYYYDLILDPEPLYDKINIFYYKKFTMAIIQYEHNNNHHYFKATQFAFRLANILNAELEFLKNVQGKIYEVLIIDFKNPEFMFMIQQLKSTYGFSVTNVLKHNIVISTVISTQIYQQIQFDNICRALKVYKFPEAQKIVDNLNFKNEVFNTKNKRRNKTRF